MLGGAGALSGAESQSVCGETGEGRLGGNHGQSGSGLARGFVSVGTMGSY